MSWPAIAAGSLAVCFAACVILLKYDEYREREAHLDRLAKARMDRLSALERLTAYVEQVEEEPGVDCEGNPFDERAWCEQWGIERWQVNF